MNEAEPPDPSVEEAARWLLKAAEDLAVADLVLTTSTGVLWAACFHAQQAAEKALKGVLVARGVDFPRTHALDRIVDLLDTAAARRFDRQTLIDLTPWAVAGRYPEDVPEPGVDEARRIFEGARAVLSAAQLLID